MFEWHEKLVKRVRPANIRLAILGKMLVVLALGSIFSKVLIPYGFFVLIAATIMVAAYASEMYLYHFRKEKVPYGTHLFGVFGAALVMLVLGIQSTFIPYQWALVIIGLVLILPAEYDIFLGHKRR